MKLSDHLKTQQKNELNKLRHKSKKKKHKLRPGELADLMGVNRDTYKRNRGAIRRK